MQPQNEDQVRSMRELLQSRKDVSAKRGAFFFVFWLKQYKCMGGTEVNRDFRIQRRDGHENVA